MTTTLTNGDKSITVWCKCSIAVSTGGDFSVVDVIPRAVEGAIGAGTRSRAADDVDGRRTRRCCG